MPVLQMKPVGFCKADPNNPRKAADESGLDHLGDDLLARGVLVPLLVKLDGTIIDGWRRWLASQRKGIKELPVIITDKPEAEIAGIRLATVFHKADLTGAEKWLACSEILVTHPDWQMKDLADFLHVDPSMLTRLLSPSKCIPAWQEALKAGKVGVSDCYAASKLPESEQTSLLALKLSGASRDQIEAAGRKTRTAAAASSVKVNRVRCVLPSGVQIVVSGDGMSLESSIEALNEAIKEMKRARELGYTAKTFAAAMKDKARKG